MAFTVSVCVPLARMPVLNGEVQTPKAPLSTLHWNVELGSVELNANCGLATLERSAGLVSIVVSGGVRSTVHVKASGALVLPTASVLVTENVCWPSASPV